MPETKIHSAQRENAQRESDQLEGDPLENDPLENLDELASALHARMDEFGPHHPATLKAAHRLAIGFWSQDDAQSAIGVLDRILETVAHGTAPLDALGADALNTLGKILFEQRQTEQACAIHREVLDFHIRRWGPAHPDALAAQGDLATVLSELGNQQEAEALEREAFAKAQQHLAKGHPVRSVLAWHVALTCQRSGDNDGFKRTLTEELLWLLAEESPELAPDQHTIRNLLAERLQWNAAATC